MNRYVFVIAIAIANLDTEDPSPGDIQFLHTLVEANNTDDAYLFGQRALEGELKKATDKLGDVTWVANDYVIPVGVAGGEVVVGGDPSMRILGLPVEDR